MRDTVKLVVLLVCFSLLMPACYIGYVSQEGTNKGKSEMSERQKEAQRYIAQRLKEGIEVKSEAHRRRCGVPVRGSIIDIGAAGSHQGKNLIIEVTINIVEEKELITIDKEWRKCPLPGSLEIDKAVNDMINEIMKVIGNTCGAHI